RSTPERIEAAVAANRLTPGDARRLVTAHRELMTVVLEQQLADLEAGVKPSSRVEGARLDRDARGRLSGYLKDIAAIGEGVRGLVAGTRAQSQSAIMPLNRATPWANSLSSGKDSMPITELPSSQGMM